ncbi:MAG: hypothetical protein Q9170_005343, partial [Blastenia crenularia]
MQSTTIYRTLGVLFSLIVSAVLLWNESKGPTLRLAKRGSFIQHSYATPTATVEHTSAFSKVPRHHSHHGISHNHLHHNTSRPLTKRALSFKDAVCKGQKFLQQINDVLEGRKAPGREYGPDDLKNGWEDVTINMDKRTIPATFIDPFRAIGKTIPNVGEREPSEAETKFKEMALTQPFRNAAGKKQK